MSQEMTQYALHNSVHAETVDKLVKDLKDSDFCVVTLVSSDEKEVTINRIFLEIFCRNVSNVLKSLNIDEASIINVPVNAKVIEHVFDLVTKGSVYIDSDACIDIICEAVKVLGVDIDTTKLTHNKKEGEPASKVNKGTSRRRNGVSKDTLKKIKEENQNRLKSILEEMNKNSRKELGNKVLNHQDKKQIKSPLKSFSVTSPEVATKINRENPDRFETPLVEEICLTEDSLEEQVIVESKDSYNHERGEYFDTFDTFRSQTKK